MYLLSENNSIDYNKENYKNISYSINTKSLDDFLYNDLINKTTEKIFQNKN